MSRNSNFLLRIYIIFTAADVLYQWYSLVSRLEQGTYIFSIYRIPGYIPLKQQQMFISASVVDIFVDSTITKST